MSDSATLPHLMRFGIYEVNLRAGELRKDGAKIKLQEQPFKVLAILLEHPGEIVTREELQKALWSTDTFVDFEHGLNKAINKIREALDDSADNPRFVETLARRGYRFIYPVAPASPPAAAVAPVGARPDVARDRRTDDAARRAALQKRIALAVGIVVVALAALFGLNVGGVRERILRRTAPVKSTLPPMRVVPFTSFPGQERDPSFSPDGNQIAFAWDGEKEDNWDIYVKVVGTESVLRLTTNPAVDRAPAWSPDGRYVAFHRHTQSEDGVYLVPALGGPERKVHSTRLGALWDFQRPCWSSDGKFLAMSEKVSGQGPLGISLVSLDTLEERSLTSPPPAVGEGDWCPRFSPDGKTLAFIRGLSGSNEVWIVPVASGEPRRLTKQADIFPHGLTWAPDSAHLIVSSGGRLWKLSVSGGELGQLDAVGENVLDPAVSSDGRRLAYVQALRDVNIWRFEIPRVPGRSKPPSKLIASTRADTAPQFSSDGKHILFASSRSGSLQFWLCDSDGSNALQLTNFRGAAAGTPRLAAGTPRWSPDGRQIAFDFNAPGKEEIYVVGVDGGAPRRLTTDKSDNVVPSWSRDGRWIYFASERTGNWQVWKMPAGGGQAVQVTKTGGFAAFESYDGKTLYYAKGLRVPGLWKVPVGGGEETLVFEQLEGGLWDYWGLTQDGIYFYNATTRAIEFFSFATHQTSKVVTPEREPIWLSPGFSVSPDGRWILYAQNDLAGSDIMLVENFRW